MDLSLWIFLNFQTAKISRLLHLVPSYREQLLNARIRTCGIFESKSQQRQKIFIWSHNSSTF